jgi:IS5 family transposase
VPDRSAIWRFRQELGRLGLSKALFGEISRQLDARGLIVRQGTLIDATIAEAAVKPPPGKDGVVSERDPQPAGPKRTATAASATRPTSRSIRVAASSAASSCPLPTCMTARPGRLWPRAMRRPSMPTRPMADRAYESQKFRDALAKAGIGDGVMHKARRNTPLKGWQRWFNKAVAPIRAAVERSFAIMKRYYGYRRVRYLGLSRNRCQLNLMSAAIKRRFLMSAPCSASRRGGFRSLRSGATTCRR